MAHACRLQGSVELHSSEPLELDQLIRFLNKLAEIGLVSSQISPPSHCRIYEQVCVYLFNQMEMYATTPNWCDSVEVVRLGDLRSIGGVGPYPKPRLHIKMDSLHWEIPIHLRHCLIRSTRILSKFSYRVRSLNRHIPNHAVHLYRPVYLFATRLCPFLRRIPILAWGFLHSACKPIHPTL